MTSDTGGEATSVVSISPTGASGWVAVTSGTVGGATSVGLGSGIGGSGWGGVGGGVAAFIG